MRKTTSVVVLAVSVVLCFAACKKDEPAAVEAPAAPAAPPATPAAPKAQPAAPQAKEPSPAEAMGQAVGALAKLAKAADQAQGGNVQGKVVNWRALAPFVPEKLGELAAEGELDGSTGGMGAMQLSRVKRRYKGGAQRATLEVADATLVPMMRAGFAMAAALNEDSTSGIKRGVKLDGNPGIVEWQKSDQRGKVTVLVGGRYIVSLELSPVAGPDPVLAQIKALELTKLAALKAE